MKDTSLCRGCRDDFYNNGQNQLGIKECWYLKTAKKVKRWKLGWWTMPTEPKAFEQVETYTCHHAPGKYALCVVLPAHAVEPVKLQRAEKVTR